MNEEAEEWRYVPEFEGIYQVSNLGRVKRLGKEGKPDNFLSGRKEAWQTGFYFNAEGRYKSYYLHRLVALVFVPNPDPCTYRYVNFIDGDPSNIKAANLVWSVKPRGRRGRRPDASLNKVSKAEDLEVDVVKVEYLSSVLKAQALQLVSSSATTRHEELQCLVMKHGGKAEIVVTSEDGRENLERLKVLIQQAYRKGIEDGQSIR